LPHGAELQHVQFSRNGRRLVSRAEPQIVRVWDVDSGRELARRTHAGAIRAIALSADGTRVASASDEAIVVWDAAAGRELTRFRHPGGSSVLSFSEDGAYLASGGFNDRAARVWDIAAGRELLDLRFPIAVDGVRFSPDGARLAVVTGTPLGRANHSVYVWRWRPADLIAEACSRLTRNLGLEEWEDRLGGVYEATCPAAPDHPIEVMRQGVAFARTGDTRRAGLAFGEAARASLARHDAPVANSICWFGSLDGFARLVLPACDHAVRIGSEADRGGFNDSRGVARALAGNRRGAIEDFAEGLAWLKATGAAKEMVARREAWLVALRTGRNPFDPATLAILKRGE
jgi:hypothetical protein